MVKMQGKTNYIKPNEYVFICSPGQFTSKRIGIENDEKGLNPKVKKRLSTTDKFFHETEFYS